MERLVPVRTRDVVIARTKAGETPKHIADALGMSVQNIYQHLKAAGIAPAKAKP